MDAGALEGKVKAAIQGGSLTAGDLGAVGTDQLGKPGGAASLDGTGKVPASQLPEMDYAPASHVADAVKHSTAAERTAWNGKAKAYRYTATIPATGWSESAPYTQTISVSGVTAAMTPTVDIVQGTDAGAAALMLDAWACVSRIDTGANKITVTCYDKAPEVNIPIQLVGVV